MNDSPTDRERDEQRIARAAALYATLENGSLRHLARDDNRFPLILECIAIGQEHQRTLHATTLVELLESALEEWDWFEADAAGASPTSRHGKWLAWLTETRKVLAALTSPTDEEQPPQEPTG